MIAHLIKSSQQNPQKEQTVFDHLTGTARIAFDLAYPLTIGSLSVLAAILHDLGKWRKAFETYIRRSVLDDKFNGRGSVNHSSAGAIYVYRRYYKGEEIQKLTAQLISTAILSHHGLNDCLSPDGKDSFHQRIEQLENLDYAEVIGNLEASSILPEVLDKLFDEAVKEVQILKQSISAYDLSMSFTIGLVQRMLLSVLIDADRLDTAIFYGDRKPFPLQQDGGKSWHFMIGYTKAYQEKAWKSTPQQNILWQTLCDNLELAVGKFTKTDEISKLRAAVSKECLDFSDRPCGIYRLTVPTGGAKTLSCMRYALNHARIYHKKRVIYLAPYLSILEQNSQVLKDTLRMNELILEHHSNVILVNPEESTCEDEYRHLTENWDAPIVVSTFVQFLNTLFSGSTGSVRRFHSLADSVIIIDEIQSLPIEMISIFNMTINYLYHITHSTIVLCSATQPVLDKVRLPIHLAKPADIIADVDELYRRLKRVRIEEVKGQQTTESLCSFITQIMEVQSDLLVILNTKKAARLLYEELKAYYQESDDSFIIIHLSTNMCAEHRLEYLNRLKNRLGKESVICISTSLIEAGVDVSFSCVIRSYSGLDKIAQAAGRCNRNGEVQEGIVYIIHYTEEKLGNLKQVHKGAVCSEIVVDLYQKNKEHYHYDLLSRTALDEFYTRYYYDKDQQNLMNYPLKYLGSSLVDLLAGNIVGKKAYIGQRGGNELPDLTLFQAFKTAGKEFTVIEQDTTAVLVPYGKGKEIIQRLSGELSREMMIDLLRKSQRFTVNLYRNQLDEMSQAGALVHLKYGNAIALKDGFYDSNIGITIEGRQEFLDI